MTLVFLFFLGKRFIPWPWHTTPDASDNSRRQACKGWHCDQSKYPDHQASELQELLEGFENGSISSEFPVRVNHLISRGYSPALCLAGFFEMIGLGFEKNLTASYDHLLDGAAKNIWSCHEALSFHPFTTDVYAHVRRGAELGGIWSMIRKGLMTNNETEAFQTFRHIALTMTSSWWKRRKSGLEYGDAVGAILKLNSLDVSEAWLTITKWATRYRTLPAAVWMAEGLQTGEIGRLNVSEAISVLRPFIVSSPWTVDVLRVMKSKDVFDKAAVLGIAEALGSEYARPLGSYVSLL